MNIINNLLADVIDEKAEITYCETLKHIENVQFFLDKIVNELLTRAKNHDKSKLKEPEFSTFVEFTEKLAKSTYGSKEYKQFLNNMKPALEHHYENNRHHPEHFDNGVDGMNLVDLIEMFCDWKSATLRHNNGDMNKSIEINKERFGLSDQLVNIFKNTLEILNNEYTE